MTPTSYLNTLTNIGVPGADSQYTYGGLLNNIAVPNPGLVQGASTVNRNVSTETPVTASELTPITSTSDTAAQQAAAEAAQAAAKQRQVDAILNSLSALDTIRNQSRTSAQEMYDKNLASYNTAEAESLAAYNKNVGQNESNLAADRQAALLTAAQGGRGLRSVLSAMGALSGTGSVLADRAIAAGANADIGEAQDTFKTNASNLTTAYQGTKREEEQRRNDAAAALQNELRSADLSRAQGRQSAFTNIANLYGLDTAQGGEYAAQASSLYPEIAAASRQEVGKYAAPSNLYSTQALQDYLAGTKDLSVKTAVGNSANTPALTAAYGRTKREDQIV